MKLKRNFFTRQDTKKIAKELIGKLIVVLAENGMRVSAMIVETEAYLGKGDGAAHSYGGRRTTRTEITYGIGGHAYVFLIYGMYHQLNVVCGKVDSPHVVLIRAVEPVEGIDIMRERRVPLSEPGAIATGLLKGDKNLTSGPGKLCIALGINKTLNGENLLAEKIWLEDHKTFTDDEIATGKRIGIDYAGDDANLPNRFWLRGNKFVSKPRLEI